MTRLRLLILVVGALVLAPAAAQAATLSAGNGVYTVYVDDSTGKYTATTGPSHPQGDGLNVLFGDGDPGTTYNSVRSYTSGTDYDETGADVDLSDFIVSTEPLGTTGFRTTWTLPGESSTDAVGGTRAAVSADRLTLTQDVYVVGSTGEDSRVVVTMRVRNDDTDPVALGIRYLWDYQIGADDGPTFKALNPDGSTQTIENDFGAPSFDSYRIEDNDTNPTPPTFNVIGTANGPSDLTPLPATPDRLAFVCWPDAVGSSFDYTTSADYEIAGGTSGECGGTPSTGDSAVLYYWGATEGSARTVAPGATTEVTAELGLTPPGGSFAVHPAPTPVPVVAPAPQPNKCVDIRKFKFKVHHGPRSRVVKVVVFVDGKKAQQFKGRNLKTVTVQKFPQVFRTVKIVVYLSNGSTRTSTRKYFECTKGKPKIKSHHHRRRGHRRH